MLSQKRVLVVEDESLVALWIEDVLIEAGAVVIGPVANVADALQIIESVPADDRIDAAVLDYNLAGISSMPVAAALVRRGVPFILQSAYMDVPRQEGVRLISKPYSPDDLVAAVAAAVV
jgi:CheY-like chemotaxis protein